MENNVIPAASITVRKGDGDQDHNIRKFIAHNVDKERIKDNVIFMNIPLQEAYRINFDEPIKAYNIGKKPSRQKWAEMEHPADGYLEKLEKDIAETADKKKRNKIPKPFYETIIQVGNMEDYGILSHPQRAQVAKEILTKYMNDFLKNNPRLYVFCAVLHMDEATPHLHIDYIPIAKDLKQGLPVRNALTQALAQQGITSGNNWKDNNNSVWQVQQIDKIKVICSNHGIQTKVVGAEKRANLSPDEYRALMAVNEQKLARARKETDKSIKHSAFGKVIVDAEKLKDERAITDVLQEQYHHCVKDLQQKTEDLQNHYQDAEADLRTEADKELQALKEARILAENAERNRQGEALIARAEQMMEGAKSVAGTAYKDARAEVRKDTEKRIKEAESRGRRLGKMEMQNEIANLKSRTIAAEKSRDNAMKKNKEYENEICSLKANLVAVSAKAQVEAERYVNLITTVKNNFIDVPLNASVRVECQKFFEGTVLFDVVKWQNVNYHTRNTNELNIS